MSINEEFGAHECAICGTDCDYVEERMEEMAKRIAELEAKLAALEEKILIWESDGVFLLKAADKMAAVCDDWVKRKIIDERSALADARLEYCDPYTFGLEKMRAALMEMDRPPDATPEITKPYICANCQDGNHHWCERIIHEPENNNECTCDCIKT